MTNKALTDALRKISDPYNQIKWIYEYFRQEVPYVRQRPSPEDFSLSEDVEDRIKAEGERINRSAEIILRLLYGIGFFFTAYLYWQSFDYADQQTYKGIIYALLCALGSYGWMALVAFEIFLSDIFEKIVEQAKKRTKLYKFYAPYRDAQLAYYYWAQCQTVDFWMRLSGHQFEDEVAKVFRRIGYKARVSKQGGDGGIDIIIEKEGNSIAVQCKAHNKPIGPSVAREFYGTLLHFGYKKGILVSRSGFTIGVYDFVSEKSIGLMNLNDILKIAATPEASVDEHKPKDNEIKKPKAEQSSFISSMEYENGRLYVAFTSGSRYVYYNVPERIAEEINAAQSLGQFFHQKVKNVYPYWRVK